MNICADILQNTENNQNFLENIITCDESWFFQYDPESKHQSMHWKSPSSPRQKKAMAELMNKLSEDDLLHCFQQWKIRMERCKDRGGEYIEGDNISIV